MIDRTNNLCGKGIAAIVAPCSARKEKLPAHRLRVMTLRKDWQSRVSRQWVARLQEASQSKDALVAAQDLYKGRAFQAVHAVTNVLACPLFVISAGLGMVRSAMRVPSYDLTISPHVEEKLQSRLRGRLDPAKWWEQVQSGPYACSMSTLGATAGRILVALTQPYAELVGSALADLPTPMRNRLRIFGGGVVAKLPREIRRNVIAYDGRLDVLSPGTRLDAPSRALVHFARLIQEHPLVDLDSDRELVEIALAGVSFPEIPSRQRASDEVLRDHLLSFAEAGLSASVALRRLRDESKLACEQRRFRRLYEEVVT